MARDLLVAGALVAGYAWLTVLSAHLRSVHRRLAVHVCRDTGRRVSPPSRALAAAEHTQPIPAAGHRWDEREEDIDGW